MTTGNAKYRRCGLCGIYKHPDDTVMLMISVAGGGAGVAGAWGKRVCWACIEGIRAEVPESRPLGLKLLEGRGQGNLFRRAVVTRLKKAGYAS